MIRSALFAVFLSLMIPVVSCGGDNNPSQQAQTSVVKDVEVDEFRKLTKDRPGTILDVRTPQEVAEGKIPGAVVINIMDSDFATRVAEFDKGKPVYVYCKAGGRSANASQKLINMGYTDVYNLLGGMDAWKAKGYEKE